MVLEQKRVHPKPFFWQEGFEALLVFFLKMFTQSFEVRGGVRSDFYWADLQWLVGGERGEIEIGGH